MVVRRPPQLWSACRCKFMPFEINFCSTSPNILVQIEGSDDYEYGEGGGGGGSHGGWTRPTLSTVNPFSYPLPLYWIKFVNLTAYEVLDVDVHLFDFEAVADSAALRRTMSQVISVIRFLKSLGDNFVSKGSPNIGGLSGAILIKCHFLSKKCFSSFLVNF